MVSINEEFKAAKAAKAAINTLSTSPKSAVLATLSKANHAAIYLKPIKRRNAERST
jgi:hypothetical protein